MANRKTDLVTAQPCVEHAAISRREFCLGGLATLAFANSVSIGAHRPFFDNKQLQPVSFDRIEIAGDLANRAHQNYNRLESDIYRVPNVFEMCDKDWPGDWEGRTLLGVTLLARSTHREAHYLDDILRLYPGKMNSQGYFGPLLDLKAINEQQMAGQGWVLRGLCEYYEWKHDERVIEMIDKAVRNLALPTHGQYSTYPIDPVGRSHIIASPGKLVAQLGNWKITGDVGSVFIFLYIRA